jgi:hypothetical protein
VKQDRQGLWQTLKRLVLNFCQWECNLKWKSAPSCIWFYIVHCSSAQLAKKVVAVSVQALITHCAHLNQILPPKFLSIYDALDREQYSVTREREGRCFSKRW